MGNRIFLFGVYGLSAVLCYFAIESGSHALGAIAIVLAFATGGKWSNEPCHTST